MNSILMNHLFFLRIGECVNITINMDDINAYNLSHFACECCQNIMRPINNVIIKHHNIDRIINSINNLVFQIDLIMHEIII